jgi:peroxiredoxin
VSRAYGVPTEELEGHRDVPSRATFVVDAERVIQFAWSARSPDEQPDLDALRKATNCRDDECTIDESDESV